MAQENKEMATHGIASWVRLVAEVFIAAIAGLGVYWAIQANELEEERDKQRREVKDLERSVAALLDNTEFLVGRKVAVQARFDALRERLEAAVGTAPDDEELNLLLDSALRLGAVLFGPSPEGFFDRMMSNEAMVGDLLVFAIALFDQEKGLARRLPTTAVQLDGGYVEVHDGYLEYVLNAEASGGVAFDLELVLRYHGRELLGGSAVVQLRSRSQLGQIGAALEFDASGPSFEYRRMRLESDDDAGGAVFRSVPDSSGREERSRSAGILEAILFDGR